ncbi:uncharacterized protein LOC110445622 isoform X2 [Mizuhopecten yessoensis]|uniref:Uncharacterized protein n=1 Tax=Mizuhopecten yessoensis TaxID=6573 RepID=A0A210QZ59_MIZYE|nr:uncharacterized protein LOC110445622 isoform X2 [Mizuhopecten yessoensis]XP_021345990.1 uncharacterized protein LOC110445622 isoform X2 [Mizuhopecten yessoensis]XP_021345991.1 uncharacterized protein LOC110445622 isoform X2 [Mizuhopecten yessoensis]XP_021345992.1 uncharacterized protein LOC110445622 isoform X2 [Mizuhopecten yessoensis]OWF54036.1 hypothetical protein KP79_PYT15285 [Mizuhopecten yessoensis]
MASAKQLNLEVIMAHSAYARAAGLQSEVNKITVTRVAGNEVEYKRQLNLYRKDMMLTINNIQREEKRLKKSMVKYRGRMQQNRRERKQREKEDYERDRRAMKNMSNVLVVQTSEMLVPVKEGSPDSGIGEEIQGKEKEEGDEDDTLEGENVNEDSENTKLKSKICVKKLRKGEDCNGKTYITLPVITEDTEDTEEKSITGTMTEDGRDSATGTHDDGKVSKDDSKTVKLPDIIKSKRRPTKTLKTKKQVVSFADLIKLQHTTSTKKLFDLVHILAEKHGVKDDQVVLKKENRNIVALRSNDQGISDSMMRAASVLYPMKFGYILGNHTDNVEPITPSSSLDEPSTDNSGLSSPLETRHSSKPSSSRVNFRISDGHNSGVRNYSRQTEPNISSVRSSYPKENMKRNNSMPTLLDVVEKVQKAHSHKQTESDSSHRRHSMSKSSSSTPRILPPLERKRMSTGNVYAQKSDAVSWTEAFALLKGVHNLFD